MRKQQLLLLGAALFLGGLAGGLAGFGAARWFAPRPLESTDILNKTIQVSEESATIDVVKKVSPAVVSIIVSKDLPNWRAGISPMDPFFRQFFGSGLDDLFGSESEGGKRQIGGGSGFLISSDGYIVTNKHVVADDQAEYTVVMNDKSEHQAKVLAKDPTNDLAVIKIDIAEASYLELGSSQSLQVGQRVIAIGNALGEFSNTVSAGVISGLSRSITAGDGFNSEKLLGLIQTDASINPGNSGGPLLDLSGKVIGINVAMAQDAQNIGFALPIDQVKSVIDNVKKNGKLIRPWLGVRYLLISPELAKRNQLPKDYGALILRGDSREDLAVIPGSPADKAGLLENDIILEVAGKKIDQDNDLAKIIATKQPGDKLELKIYRKGQEKLITVSLETAK